MTGRVVVRQTRELAHALCRVPHEGRGLVDLVDSLDASLADNTDCGIAPSLTACGEALRELLADMRALTITEFDPHAE